MTLLSLRCVAVSSQRLQGEALDHDLGAGGPPRAGMINLVRSHWGLGSRLLADVFGPTWSAEDRAVFTGFQRAAAWICGRLP